jgi:hypothetical protein
MVEGAPERFPVADLSRGAALAMERSRTVDPTELARQLKTISDAVARVVDDAPAGRLGLAEVEISLTIGAEGGVWFVAKGSAEASIVLRFKR